MAPHYSGNPENPPVHYKETRYGFEWGPVVVKRAASDPKGGFVVMVESKYQRLDIRFSPEGRNVGISVHRRDSDGTWWCVGDVLSNWCRRVELND